MDRNLSNDKVNKGFDFNVYGGGWNVSTTILIYRRILIVPDLLSIKGRIELIVEKELRKGQVTNEGGVWKYVVGHLWLA